LHGHIHSVLIQFRDCGCVVQRKIFSISNDSIEIRNGIVPVIVSNSSIGQNFLEIDIITKVINKTFSRNGDDIIESGVLNDFNRFSEPDIIGANWVARFELDGKIARAGESDKEDEAERNEGLHLRSNFDK